MIPHGQLTGVVLAGGRSRRMGRDKAQLVVESELLWQRQVRVLHEAGAVVVGLARRPDQEPLGLPPEIPVWTDRFPDAGPLAGLHAALGACTTPWLAALAVDMPQLDAGWFEWLAEHAASGRGAVAQHSHGAFEPLATIYPRAALAGIERAAQAAEFRLQDVVRSLVEKNLLAAVPLPESETWRVANWNSPEPGGGA